MVEALDPGCAGLCRVGDEKYPESPSTPYYRTLGPDQVPKTINKDYLDP